MEAQAAQRLARWSFSAATTVILPGPVLSLKRVPVRRICAPVLGPLQPPHCRGARGAGG